jgi:hypothetical protein
MQIIRPYFTIQVRAGNCQAEIRINDVPIVGIKDGESLSVEVPVNQWVVTGRDTLSFLLSPLTDMNFDDIAWCEATLYCRPVGTPRERRVRLGGMIFSGEDRKNGTGLEQSPDFDIEAPIIVQAGERPIQAQRLIQLSTPFPGWLWLSSEVIPETPQTKTELYNVYRTFWRHLSDRNIAEITNLTSAKVKELAAAYYLSLEAADDQIEFRQHMENPGVYLQEFPSSEDNLQLEVFGNKRLARLVTKRGNCPIAFVMNDKSLAFYMNMMFCKSVSQGWVQIR